MKQFSDQLSFDHSASPSFERVDEVVASNDFINQQKELFCISGSVEKVNYFDVVTGQCLLDVKTDSSKSRLLIQGRTSSVYPGQAIQAFLKDPIDLENQDDSIPTVKLVLENPVTTRTTKKFLKSDAFSGIADNVAKSLSVAFPDSLFKVLEENPKALNDVAGIGPKKKTQVIQSWAEYKLNLKIKEYLFANDLPLEWSSTLKLHYQDQAIEVLKSSPYLTASKHNFSFAAIDYFARRLGFPEDSEDRARCAIKDSLQTYFKQGHCAYPEKKLLQEVDFKLGISSETVENAFELELLSENLVLDQISGQTCVYLKENWEMEQQVASKLMQIAAKESPWGWFNSDKVLGWAQNLLNITLAPLQKEAIETALSANLSIITGGPGTGKTTLIRSLIAILQTQFLNIALCSPTGRGAKRLEETTGVAAKTIHRLLKYDGMTGEFQYNHQNPIQADLVLIDEVSMVDVALMYRLLDALPDHCALIVVGDADQLPSVGAGNVLQSMIASKRFAMVKLTDIFRQSDKSLIKVNAQLINAGKMPVMATSEDTDFHYIPIHGSEEAKKVVIDLVTNVIPEKYGIRDQFKLQVLVPQNGGELGTIKLNEELQKIFTKTDSDSLSLSGLGQKFRTGDKVMVIKNDYIKNVFNGDIGIIKKIHHEEQFIEVTFEDRTIRFELDELDRLTLAYAISIHKSQGSEYRAVVVVITDEHQYMAQRHLLYTAVTRGKEHVFLVADPATLQSSVLSDEHNRRWQKLTELLAS